MKLVRIAALALACASLVAKAQDSLPASQPPAGSPAAGSVATVAPAASPAIENSVVKIFSTLSRPDPYRPWARGTPQEATGTGVVIEGKRILTNAHVVGYASQLQVQASQD